jgi:hypothetical protein
VGTDVGRVVPIALYPPDELDHEEIVWVEAAAILIINFCPLTGVPLGFENEDDPVRA